MERKTAAEMMIEARGMSIEELERAAQGCTELSCPYHGVYNEVRRQRRANKGRW